MFSTKRKRNKLGQFTKTSPWTKRFSRFVPATFVILGMLFFNIYPTNAYFNDTESSVGNTYTAGTLGLDVTSVNDFSPQLTPTQNSSRDITVAKQGSLDLQYKVKLSNLSGNFCQNINLEATLNSVILYSGSLVDFNIATTTNLGTINFVASSTAHGFNQSCNFDLVFTGWQVNLDNESLGFSDKKTISNSIVGGQTDVVLNEFLPNPIGSSDSLDGLLGEWIEFYNNSNQAIDMTGWYTEDASSGGNRRTISSATTYNNQTTIGAKGSGSEWLVLFMNDAILNNGTDTITLYDNYGGLVDTYSYSGSDYNNNSTPDSTNNLVAYLPFNNDLLDKSGNNNNGINYGTSFTTVSNGKAEQALNLTGTQYVEVPNSASLDITNQITLEAWVYPTSWSSNENSILTKAGDGEYGAWNLHYKTTTSGFRFELNNGSSHAIFETTPSTAVNTWYHVVGVYDGSEMKLYVNGVLSGSLVTSGSIATNDSPLRIGKQWYWGSTYSYWAGRIDEVKIYNRALSATEVSEHYNYINDGEMIIPENKSFARIPDGVGAWVDPIPTPGEPNKIEENTPLKAQMAGNEPLVAETATSTELIATSTDFIASTTPEMASTTEIIIETASTTPEVIIEEPAIIELPVTEPEIIIEPVPVVETPVVESPAPVEPAI